MMFFFEMCISFFVFNGNIFVLSYFKFEYCNLSIFLVVVVISKVKYFFFYIRIYLVIYLKLVIVKLENKFNVNV